MAVLRQDPLPALQGSLFLPAEHTPPGPAPRWPSAKKEASRSHEGRRGADWGLQGGDAGPGGRCSPALLLESRSRVGQPGAPRRPGLLTARGSSPPNSSRSAPLPAVQHSVVQTARRRRRPSSPLARFRSRPAHLHSYWPLRDAPNQSAPARSGDRL